MKGIVKNGLSFSNIYIAIIVIIVSGVGSGDGCGGFVGVGDCSSSCGGSGW